MLDAPYDPNGESLHLIKKRRITAGRRHKLCRKDNPKPLSPPGPYPPLSTPTWRIISGSTESQASPAWETIEDLNPDPVLEIAKALWPDVKEPCARRALLTLRINELNTLLYGRDYLDERFLRHRRVLMMLNRQRAVCPQINMRRTREVNAEAIAMSTCWTEDSMQGFDNIEARLMVMNVEGMGWQVLDDEVAFVKTGGIPGVKIKKKMIVGGGSR